MHCPVCLSMKTKPCFGWQDYPLDRCMRCSHLFVAKSIPDTELGAAYGQDYYVATGPDGNGPTYDNYMSNYDRRLLGFRRWYRDAAKLTGPPGRSLDYGCAIGVAVKAAEESGWKAIGYERSRWAVEFGRKTLEANLIHGDGTTDPFGPESFDLVTMFDVVEHLQEPRLIIGRARQWLPVGGWIAITTVNSSSLGARLAGKSWRHIAPPFHLQYFNRRSLTYLLRAHGFEPRRIHFRGPVLRARRDQGRTFLLDSIDAVLMNWRLQRVPFGDEIEVIAQRIQGS